MAFLNCSNMSKYLTLFFFIFVTMELSAQTNNFSHPKWSHFPGETATSSDFVILASGEKIFGSIARDYNLANYDEVVFEENGSKRVFFPRDLEGFGLKNGQLFFSKALPDSSGPVFLQVLISGDLELTKYRGRYFLSNKDRFEELKNTFQVMVNEKSRQRTIRPYIATLKSFLIGECGIERYPKIDRLPFSDQPLITMVQDYLSCTQQDFQTHLNNVPVFKISPLLGGGVSHFSLTPVENLSERADQLTQKIGYFGFVGIRFHDFRLLPRLSTDLRLGLTVFETGVVSSYAGTQLVWTGSEQIRESALYIPWSFHYSVVKKEQMEFYLGFSAGLWYGTVTAEDGMIDERRLTAGEIWIRNEQITTGLGSKFIPGFKMGTNFRLKGQKRFFAELEYSSQSSYYRFTLSPNESDYNRDRLSLQLGVEF